jgi:hypothetical protein
MNIVIEKARHDGTHIFRLQELCGGVWVTLNTRWSIQLSDEDEVDELKEEFTELAWGWRHTTAHRIGELRVYVQPDTAKNRWGGATRARAQPRRYTLVSGVRKEAA